MPGRSRESLGLDYRVGYALAVDHLRAGTSVIADTANPIAITREAWHGVAREAGVPVIDVEVVCWDVAEHRRRVEARVADIPGHVEPTWDDVITREYEPLQPGPRALRVDTAAGTDAAVKAALARLTSPQRRPCWCPEP